MDGVSLSWAAVGLHPARLQHTPTPALCLPARGHFPHSEALFWVTVTFQPSREQNLLVALRGPGLGCFRGRNWSFRSWGAGLTGMFSLFSSLPAPILWFTASPPNYAKSPLSLPSDLWVGHGDPEKPKDSPAGAVLTPSQSPKPTSHPPTPDGGASAIYKPLASLRIICVSLQRSCLAAG